MGEYQLQSVLRSLEEQKLIQKTEDNFLITPKGIIKAKYLNLQKAEPCSKSEWDGRWRIVIFDIPEENRRARNIFRAILKRKGYIKLQNSVFICPFGDFDLLNEVRHEYGIEKFVNFLIAQTDEIENDENLLLRFGL